MPLTPIRKVPRLTKITINQGNDIAGIVHAVGTKVYEFKPGDRVAAFHQMMTPGGSYAEFAVSPQHTTFHIPNETSFEEAATIPLAAMTAAIGLYIRLGLPEPTKPTKQRIPLVIYGAGSAVGAFALQLAKRSGIHPLICVAGRAQEFVRKFLEPEKGDAVVDYRNGDDAVVKGLKEALEGEKLYYAFDAVSEHSSYQNISKVLEPDGHITLVLPGKKYEEIPSSVDKSTTSVGTSHNGNEDFAYLYFRLFARGLQEGWFKGHPHQVVPGGLGGIQQALQNLKDGKASATKYVFKIDETEGVQKSTL